jgi:hypothetical protein
MAGLPQDFIIDLCKNTSSPNVDSKLCTETTVVENGNLKHTNPTRPCPIGIVVSKEKNEQAAQVSQAQQQSSSATASSGNLSAEYFILHVTGGRQENTDHHIHEHCLVLLPPKAYSCCLHGPLLGFQTAQTSQSAGNPNLVERMVLEKSTETSGILLDHLGRPLLSRENCICPSLVEVELDMNEDAENEVSLG